MKSTLIVAGVKLHKVSLYRRARLPSIGGGGVLHSVGGCLARMKTMLTQGVPKKSDTMEIILSL